MADGARDDPRSRDLWRTSLCSHGAEHASRDPHCRFAHSLSELRCPDESRVGYGDEWSHHNVDRFYGQAMSRDQLDRIWRYYNGTARCDRPLWAIGLYLLELREECSLGLALPWDFGLVRDYDDLVAARRGRQCPFRLYPQIWERLHQRRSVLLDYVFQPHILHHMVVPEEFPPGPAEPMEPPWALPAISFSGGSESEPLGLGAGPMVRRSRQESDSGEDS